MPKRFVVDWNAVRAIDLESIARDENEDAIKELEDQCIMLSQVI